MLNFLNNRRIEHYFPIYAKHRLEILQMDLMDASDLKKAFFEQRW